MANRSTKSADRKRRPARLRDTASDDLDRKGHGPADFGTMSMEGFQVVNRHCTICDWEAQLVERGMGEDPLCPWCYGPTERTSVLGLVIPEALRPGQKNPYASSLGRLGGLKGGPARAAKLSAKQRREIASKAAKARWAGARAKPGRAGKPGADAPPVRDAKPARGAKAARSAPPARAATPARGATPARSATKKPK